MTERTPSPPGGPAAAAGKTPPDRDAEGEDEGEDEGGAPRDGDDRHLKDDQTPTDR